MKDREVTVRVEESIKREELCSRWVAENVFILYLS
jgi:hypothetical protein